MRPGVGAVALLGLAACAGGSAPRAAVWPGPWTRPTQSGLYVVALSFDPSAPEVGALFRAEARVTSRDGTPLEAGKVALDARMPQHNHGMETDPVDLPGVCDAAGACTHPGGLFQTDGFKFHMPGAWTVTVEVTGPRGPDTTSFVVEVP